MAQIHLLLTDGRIFLKNILISGGYSYLSQFIAFAASLITSRLLLPEYFGLVGLITVFSGFIGIFADSGLSHALIRTNYSNRYTHALHYISVIFGIILCFITALLAYPIALFYNNSFLLWPTIIMGFVFIPKTLSIVPGAMLQKEMRFNELGLGSLIYTLVVVFFTVVFALAGFEHWAIVLPQIIGTFVQYRWLTSRVSFKGKEMTKPQLIASFRVTKSLITSITGFNFINYWSRNADNLLVGKFYGTHDLGIYNRAYSLLLLPLSLITGLFSAVMYPTLVRMKKKTGSYQNEYYRILKIISLLNFPVGLVLILIPTWFVNLLWGENWIEVASLLPYFGLLIFSQSLISTIGHVLILEGRERLLMYSGWVSAVFLVGGIFYGVIHSLIATAAWYSFVFVTLIFSYNILIFFKELKHAARYIIGFWLPKYILSVLIWVGIFFDIPAVVYVSLLGYFAHLLGNTYVELISFWKASTECIQTKFINF